MIELIARLDAIRKIANETKFFTDGLDYLTEDLKKCCFSGLGVKINLKQIEKETIKFLPKEITKTSLRSLVKSTLVYMQKDEPEVLGVKFTYFAIANKLLEINGDLFEQDIMDEDDIEQLQNTSECEELLNGFWITKKGFSKNPETGKLEEEVKHIYIADGTSRKDTEWLNTFDFFAQKKDRERKIFKNLDECQTTDDVEDYFYQQDYFLHKGDKRSDDALDLSGCDIEVAKETFKAYETVFKKFPNFKNSILPVMCRQLSSGTYAYCMLNDGMVCINKSYYKNKEKLNKHYNSDLDAGFHPKGTDWRAIVYHEIGHAIDGLITGKESMLFGTKSTDIFMEVKKEVKYNSIEKDVSGYGATNHKEFFAEAFCEYMCSKTPRPVAKKVGEILERIYKKGK